MNSTIFNLKKYVFPFIMMVTLLIFGVRSCSNVVLASTDRVISINKVEEVANASIKDKCILKFGKDITSFDLSTLPQVNEKTKIVIQSENSITGLTLKNKLPSNYELPLVIGYVSCEDNTNVPSYYYPNKGTEKSPDILILETASFDLSLLPDASSSRQLCIIDECKTEGIDFEDSVLPQNYVVSKIFILNEKDKQTFKDAFPKAEISVIKAEDIMNKVTELLFGEDDTSKTTNNNDSNSKQSDTSITVEKSSNSDSKTTSSTKQTGEDLSHIYVLGGCFITFSTISLLFLLKKRKSN
jgi:LPXTG-motif cell wall-anchored protein